MWGTLILDEHSFLILLKILLRKMKVIHTIIKTLVSFQNWNSKLDFLWVTTKSVNGSEQICLSSLKRLAISISNVAGEVGIENQTFASCWAYKRKVTREIELGEKIVNLSSSTWWKFVGYTVNFGVFVCESPSKGNPKISLPSCIQRS